MTMINNLVDMELFVTSLCALCRLCCVCVCVSALSSVSFSHIIKYPLKIPSPRFKFHFFFHTFYSTFYFSGIRLSRYRYPGYDLIDTKEGFNLNSRSMVL